MFLVRALDGYRVGLTAVNGDRLRHAATADRLLEEPSGGLLIPVLREQNVDRLAVCIHGAIEGALFTVDADARLVHPPAAPHRSLAAAERRFPWGTVLDDPAVDAGVIHGDPTLAHACFDVARTQGIRYVPADAREHDVLGDMGPLETHDHRLSPSRCAPDRRGRSYAKNVPKENLRQNLLRTLD
jgi:hypothetical protein